MNSKLDNNNTPGRFVFTPLPHGTKISPRFFPLDGAFLPHPFVDILPGGSRLA